MNSRIKDILILLLNLVFVMSLMGSSNSNHGSSGGSGSNGTNSNHNSSSSNNNSNSTNNSEAKQHCSFLGKLKGDLWGDKKARNKELKKKHGLNDTKGKSKKEIAEAKAKYEADKRKAKQERDEAKRKLKARGEDKSQVAEYAKLAAGDIKDLVKDTASSLIQQALGPVLDLMAGLQEAIPNSEDRACDENNRKIANSSSSRNKNNNNKNKGSNYNPGSSSQNRSVVSTSAPNSRCNKYATDKEKEDAQIKKLGDPRAAHEDLANANRMLQYAKESGIEAVERRKKIFLDDLVFDMEFGKAQVDKAKKRVDAWKGNEKLWKKAGSSADYEEAENKYKALYNNYVKYTNYIDDLENKKLKDNLEELERVNKEITENKEEKSNASTKLNQAKNMLSKHKSEKSNYSDTSKWANIKNDWEKSIEVWEKVKDFRKDAITEWEKNKKLISDKQSAFNKFKSEYLKIEKQYKKTNIEREKSKQNESVNNDGMGFAKRLLDEAISKDKEVDSLITEINQEINDYLSNSMYKNFTSNYIKTIQDQINKNKNDWNKVKKDLKTYNKTYKNYIKQYDGDEEDEAFLEKVLKLLDDTELKYKSINITKTKSIFDLSVKNRENLLNYISNINQDLSKINNKLSDISSKLKKYKNSTSIKDILKKAEDKYKIIKENLKNIKDKINNKKPLVVTIIQKAQSIKDNEKENNGLYMQVLGLAKNILPKPNDYGQKYDRFVNDLIEQYLSKHNTLVRKLRDFADESDDDFKVAKVKIDDLEDAITKNKKLWNDVISNVKTEKNDIDFEKPDIEYKLIDIDKIEKIYDKEIKDCDTDLNEIKELKKYNDKNLSEVTKYYSSAKNSTIKNKWNGLVQKWRGSINIVKNTESKVKKEKSDLKSLFNSLKGKYSKLSKVREDALKLKDTLNIENSNELSLAKKSYEKAEEFISDAKKDEKLAERIYNDLVYVEKDFPTIFKESIELNEKLIKMYDDIIMNIKDFILDNSKWELTKEATKFMLKSIASLDIYGFYQLYKSKKNKLPKFNNLEDRVKATEATEPYYREATRKFNKAQTLRKKYESLSDEMFKNNKTATIKKAESEDFINKAKAKLKNNLTSLEKAEWRKAKEKWKIAKNYWKTRVPSWEKVEKKVNKLLKVKMLHGISLTFNVWQINLNTREEVLRKRKAIRKGLDEEDFKENDSVITLREVNEITEILERLKSLSEKINDLALDFEKYDSIQESFKSKEPNSKYKVLKEKIENIISLPVGNPALKAGVYKPSEIKQKAESVNDEYKSVRDSVWKDDENELIKYKRLLDEIDELNIEWESYKKERKKYKKEVQVLFRRYVKIIDDKIFFKKYYEKLIFKLKEVLGKNSKNEKILNVLKQCELAFSDTKKLLKKVEEDVENKSNLFSDNYSWLKKIEKEWINIEALRLKMNGRAEGSDNLDYMKLIKKYRDEAESIEKGMGIIEDSYEKKNQKIVNNIASKIPVENNFNKKLNTIYSELVEINKRVDEYDDLNNKLKALREYPEENWSNIKKDYLDIEDEVNEYLLKVKQWIKTTKTQYDDNQETLKQIKKFINNSFSNEEKQAWRRLEDQYNELNKYTKDLKSKLENEKSDAKEKFKEYTYIFDTNKKLNKLVLDKIDLIKIKANPDDRSLDDELRLSREELKVVKQLKDLRKRQDVGTKLDNLVKQAIGTKIKNWLALGFTGLKKFALKQGGILGPINKLTDSYTEIKELATLYKKLEEEIKTIYSKEKLRRMGKSTASATANLVKMNKYIKGMQLIIRKPIFIKSKVIFEPLKIIKGAYQQAKKYYKFPELVLVDLNIKNLNLRKILNYQDKIWEGIKKNNDVNNEIAKEYFKIYREYRNGNLEEVLLKHKKVAEDREKKADNLIDKYKSDNSDSGKEKLTALQEIYSNWKKVKEKYTKLAKIFDEDEKESMQIFTKYIDDMKNAQDKAREVIAQIKNERDYIENEVAGISSDPSQLIDDAKAMKIVLESNLAQVNHFDIQKELSAFVRYETGYLYEKFNNIEKTIRSSRDKFIHPKDISELEVILKKLKEDNSYGVKAINDAVSQYASIVKEIDLISDKLLEQKDKIKLNQIKCIRILEKQDLEELLKKKWKDAKDAWDENKKLSNKIDNKVDAQEVELQRIKTNVSKYNTRLDKIREDIDFLEKKYNELNEINEIGLTPQESINKANDWLKKAYDNDDNITIQSNVIEPKGLEGLLLTGNKSHKNNYKEKIKCFQQYIKNIQNIDFDKLNLEFDKCVISREGSIVNNENLIKLLLNYDEKVKIHIEIYNSENGYKKSLSVSDIILLLEKLKSKATAYKQSSEMNANKYPDQKSDWNRSADIWEKVVISYRSALSGINKIKEKIDRIKELKRMFNTVEEEYNKIKDLAREERGHVEDKETGNNATKNLILAEDELATAKSFLKKVKEYKEKYDKDYKVDYNEWEKARIQAEEETGILKAGRKNTIYQKTTGQLSKMVNSAHKKNTVAQKYRDVRDRLENEYKSKKEYGDRIWKESQESFLRANKKVDYVQEKVKLESEEEIKKTWKKAEDKWDEARVEWKKVQTLWEQIIKDAAMAEDKFMHKMAVINSSKKNECGKLINKNVMDSCGKVGFVDKYARKLKPVSDNVFMGSNPFHGAGGLLMYVTRADAGDYLTLEIRNKVGFAQDFRVRAARRYQCVNPMTPEPEMKLKMNGREIVTQEQLIDLDYIMGRETKTITIKNGKKETDPEYDRDVNGGYDYICLYSIKKGEVDLENWVLSQVAIIGKDQFLSPGGAIDTSRIVKLLDELKVRIKGLFIILSDTLEKINKDVTELKRNIDDLSSNDFLTAREKATRYLTELERISGTCVETMDKAEEFQEYFDKLVADIPMGLQEAFSLVDMQEFAKTLLPNKSIPENVLEPLVQEPLAGIKSKCTMVQDLTKLAKMFLGLDIEIPTDISPVKLLYGSSITLRSVTYNSLTNKIYIKGSLVLSLPTISDDTILLDTDMSIVVPRRLSDNAYKRNAIKTLLAKIPTEENDPSANAQSSKMLCERINTTLNISTEKTCSVESFFTELIKSGYVDVFRGEKKIASMGVYDLYFQNLYWKRKGMNVSLTTDKMTLVLKNESVGDMIPVPLPRKIRLDNVAVSPGGFNFDATVGYPENYKFDKTISSAGRFYTDSNTKINFNYAQGDMSLTLLNVQYEPKVGQGGPGYIIMKLNPPKLVKFSFPGIAVSEPKELYKLLGFDIDLDYARYNEQTQSLEFKGDFKIAVNGLPNLAPIKSWKLPFDIAYKVPDSMVNDIEILLAIKTLVSMVSQDVKIASTFYNEYKDDVKKGAMLAGAMTVDAAKTILNITSSNPEGIYLELIAYILKGKTVSKKLCYGGLKDVIQIPGVMTLTGACPVLKTNGLKSGTELELGQFKVTFDLIKNISNQDIKMPENMIVENVKFKADGVMNYETGKIGPGLDLSEATGTLDSFYVNAKIGEFKNKPGEKVNVYTTGVARIPNVLNPNNVSRVWMAKVPVQFQLTKTNFGKSEEECKKLIDDKNEELDGGVNEGKDKWSFTAFDYFICLPKSDPVELEVTMRLAPMFEIVSIKILNLPDLSEMGIDKDIFTSPAWKDKVKYFLLKTLKLGVIGTFLGANSPDISVGNEDKRKAAGYLDYAKDIGKDADEVTTNDAEKYYKMMQTTYDNYYEVIKSSIEYAINKGVTAKKIKNGSNYEHFNIYDKVIVQLENILQKLAKKESIDSLVRSTERSFYSGLMKERELLNSLVVDSSTNIKALGAYQELAQSIKRVFGIEFKSTFDAPKSALVKPLNKMILALTAMKKADDLFSEIVELNKSVANDVHDTEVYYDKVADGSSLYLENTKASMETAAESNKKIFLKTKDLALISGYTLDLKTKSLDKYPSRYELKINLDMILPEENAEAMNEWLEKSREQEDLLQQKVNAQKDKVSWIFNATKPILIKILNDWKSKYNLDSSGLIAWLNDYSASDLKVDYAKFLYDNKNLGLIKATENWLIKQGVNISANINDIPKPILAVALWLKKVKETADYAILLAIRIDQEYKVRERAAKIYNYVKPVLLEIIKGWEIRYKIYSPKFIEWLNSNVEVPISMGENLQNSLIEFIYEEKTLNFIQAVEKWLEKQVDKPEPVLVWLEEVKKSSFYENLLKESVREKIDNIFSE